MEPGLSALLTSYSTRGTSKLNRSQRRESGAAVGFVKSKARDKEADKEYVRLSGSKVRGRGQRAASRGGLGDLVTGGQGDLVTAAPVSHIFLVGPPGPLYEKKVHVPVAFDPTLSRRPILQAFFALAASLLPWFGSSSVIEARAQAQPPPSAEPTWAVEMMPASRCADDAAFVDQLTDQIPEGQRAPLGKAELRAQVMIGRDQTATIQVVDQLSQREAGQRQLAVPRGGCDAAADALSLVMAVMVEAGRSLLPPPPAPKEGPPPGPPPEPSEERAEAPEPPEPPTQLRYRPARRHAWLGPPPGHDLFVAAGSGYGLMPRWGVGGTAAWGIRWSRAWPIWLSGSGWLEQQGTDGRGRFVAAYGTLATCPLLLEKGRIRGELCPGLAIGAMWSEGRGVAETQRAVTPLAMASLALQVRIRLVGPLELVGITRAEAPVTRLTFVYYREDGRAPEIHQTTPVVVSFFGGLGLRFR